MVCGGIDPGNSYLWLTLSSILLGGGFSFLFAPRRRRRLTTFIVFLSISLLLLLLSFALAGFRVPDLRFVIYWASGSVVIGFLGFFFWKFAGIPILFLFAISVSALWYSVYDWQCAEPGGEICRFSIISEGEGFRTIQYEMGKGEQGFERLTGNGIYSRLDIVSLPDYFFILGHDRIYNFLGFSQISTVDDNVFENYSFVIRLLSRLPGVRFESHEEPLRISPSVEYSISFDNEVLPELIKHIE
ncbi:MAG: hypothetical protein PQJ61_15235 [Spirochaetales bacterium]|uniref:Uncharacterized protein n=1 Tax=Candidatus Thalassospirochaeta sargassi TaxID=3119039 RepID=A0AAJ1IJF4_9SPIO|nr:hypothetical protein [Spirochaetales bacterium]